MRNSPYLVIHYGYLVLFFQRVSGRNNSNFATTGIQLLESMYYNQQNTVPFCSLCLPSITDNILGS